MTRHRETCTCRDCELRNYLLPYAFWALVFSITCFSIAKAISPAF